MLVKGRSIDGAIRITLVDKAKLVRLTKAFYFTWLAWQHESSTAKGFVWPENKKDSFADWIQFQSSFDPLLSARYFPQGFVSAARVSLDLIRLVFWLSTDKYIVCIT